MRDLRSGAATLALAGTALLASACARVADADLRREVDRLVSPETFVDRKMALLEQADFTCLVTNPSDVDCSRVRYTRIVTTCVQRVTLVGGRLSNIASDVCLGPTHCLTGFWSSRLRERTVRVWIVTGLALTALCLSAQTQARQLRPEQAQRMLATIQNLNHCRIAEAKKIDDGSSSVGAVAQRVAPLCSREKDAARRSLTEVDIGANAADIDDIERVKLAVRQERSPESNILGPR